MIPPHCRRLVDASRQRFPEMYNPSGVGATARWRRNYHDCLSGMEGRAFGASARPNGDEFEEIERRQFGKDGFEDAVAQIGQGEAALGYADLAGFNAPPPSKT